jgi:putative membrane protein insertion efficiency factor
VSRVRNALWWAGAPARFLMIVAIRMYRATLSGMLGGQCRFHPSCSEYAEQAIRSVGALRGGALAAWRILRCSPLSAGGVDRAPGAARAYDSTIHARRSAER